MKKFLSLIGIALLLLLTAFITHADIYYWVDGEGISHFSNSVPSQPVGDVIIYGEMSYDPEADQKRTEADDKLWSEYVLMEEKLESERSAREDVLRLEAAPLKRYEPETETDDTDVHVIYIGHRRGRIHRMMAPPSPGLVNRTITHKSPRLNKHDFRKRSFNRHADFPGQAPGLHDPDRLKQPRDPGMLKYLERGDRQSPPEQPVPRSGGMFPTERRNRFGEWPVGR